MEYNKFSLGHEYGAFPSHHPGSSLSCSMEEIQHMFRKFVSTQLKQFTKLNR